MPVAAIEKRPTTGGEGDLRIMIGVTTVKFYITVDHRVFPGGVLRQHRFRPPGIGCLLVAELVMGQRQEVARESAGLWVRTPVLTGPPESESNRTESEFYPRLRRRTRIPPRAPRLQPAHQIAQRRQGVVDLQPQRGDRQ